MSDDKKPNEKRQPVQAVVTQKSDDYEPGNLKTHIKSTKEKR